MKPAKFKEATTELQAPKGMDNCGPLWVASDGVYCISKWGLTWKERLKLLFQGHVWLWVVSGKTQPPVSIDLGFPFQKQ